MASDTVVVPQSDAVQLFLHLLSSYSYFFFNWMGLATVGVFLFVVFVLVYLARRCHCLIAQRMVNPLLLKNENTVLNCTCY